MATAAYWTERADAAQAERAQSLAMARKTGESIWRDFARAELERELRYRAYADEAADKELRNVA